MLIATAETGALPPDPWTIGLALVTGLLGGVAGAWVAARAQRTLARASARREAAKSLWNFHRVLHDYALEMELRETQSDNPSITRTTSTDIANARAEAYVYRSYLPGGASALLSRQFLPAWDDSTGYMGISDDVWEWAGQLETMLTEVFGAEA